MLLGRLGPPDDFAFAGERRYYLYRLDLRSRAYHFGAADPTRAALCHLLFRVDGGVVSDVRMRGVDFSGLDAEGRCAIIARRLLRRYE